MGQFLIACSIPSTDSSSRLRVDERWNSFWSRSLTGWLTGCLTSWLTSCLTGSLTGCLTGWLTGCLTGWLAGWLVQCAFMEEAVTVCRVPTPPEKSWIFSLKIPGPGKSWESILDSHCHASFQWFKWKTSSNSIAPSLC